MIRLRLLLPLVLTCLALWTGPAAAQHTVIQQENVRFDYAQVLRVTPVYQTLTATRAEQRCGTAEQAKQDSRLSRAVGAIKDALRREEAAQAQAGDCRTVPVEREFRRPIAYDVDYVYKGAKFRSRLPEDPGNRLRIRIAITPAVPGATAPP
ncbi:MAG TPA: hypothetical protein VIT66_06765 [Lysobacter sp.]